MNKSLLLFILTVSILGVFLIFPREKILERLNVSFVNPRPISYFDPANIQFDYQAVALRQLYLTLFIYGDEGKIENLAAENYTFENSVLKIKIKKNIISSKGDLITAKDFEYSFKRLLKLASNTHGDLNLFIDTEASEKISELWKNIWSEEDILFIRLKENVAISLFLPILSSNDFCVIPYNAIDWKSDKLEITDYTNTSGAYHYKTSLEDKTIVLELNLKSIINTENSPRIINLIPTWGDATYKKMSLGEIEIKTTVDPMRTDKITLLEDSGKFIHKKTLDIKELSFHFRGSARKNLSQKQKIEIGHFLREQILSKGMSLFGDYKPSFQLISPIAKGALSQDNLDKIKNTFKNLKFDENFDPGFDIKIVAFGIPHLDFEKIFGHIKWLKRVKIDEDPDVFFGASDSNFYESVSFLSYNFSFGKLSSKSMSNEQWLNMYIQTPNKSDRLKLLQELHFENLESGNIIPVGHSHYSVVHRKDLNVPMYKEFAEMMLWKVTQK